MKKEQNMKEMVLRDHYNALTEKQKTDLREKVLSESSDTMRLNRWKQL